jgi:hypothetical protein
MSSPATAPAHAQSPKRGFVWRAIAWGAVVAFAIELNSFPALSSHLLDCCEHSDAINAVLDWMPVIAPLLGGLVAGWIARTRGAIHGALAALVATVPGFATAALMQASRGSAAQAVLTPEALFWSVPGMVAAAWAGVLAARLRRGRDAPAQAHGRDGIDAGAIALGAAVIFVPAIAASFAVDHARSLVVMLSPLLTPLMYLLPLAGGALAGFSARRSGARHGALASLLATATLWVFSVTWNIVKGSAAELQKADHWWPMLISAATGLVLAAIAGWIAVRVATKSRG